MDKKPNRNSSNSSRASSGTDLKKSLDGSTCKLGARAAPRRREPPGGFSKSSETNRKPQPQRNGKAFDKRPKPRGYYYAGALPRTEEASLDDFNEPELGSIFSPGSKKQSLNHLLNFTFAPRENYQASNKVEGKLITTRKHKYNKEHYLQANCQFIVNEKGDYKQYMTNQDALVDWDLIEQVIVQVDDQPSCPICLYPPVAAKMTKCGHVYCWSCMLHYLALSDHEWCKCPICFDAVKKHDLKSVTVVSHRTFNVNDTIVFKLMKRLSGSFTAYPADSEIQLEDVIYNISDKTRENASSKLFSANAENILEIINRESVELEVLMADNQNEDGICFVEEAKRLLQIRKDQVCAHIDQMENITEQYKPQHNEEKPSSVEAEGGSKAAKFYYFYQAEDGQHIYLHAINAKMLEHSYGSLEFGPKTLKGRILEKEGGSMTEELRKKLRYLQHLPITCQFEVAEIKLEEPAITKDTVDYFKDQVEIRKKRRQRKAKEERRREKKIEVEENRKIGKYVTPELHLDNKFQFPDVTESHERFPDIIDLRQRSESEAPGLPRSGSASPESPSLLYSKSLENNFMSFSKVLSNSKEKQSSSTPVRLRNVTGPVMTSSPISRRRDSHSDQEDAFEAAPDYHRTIAQALAEAIEKGLEIQDENVTDEVSQPVGKKKKKRNKGKVLFSSHMAFSGN